jgi:hypothetical protein
LTWGETEYTQAKMKEEPLKQTLARTRISCNSTPNTWIINAAIIGVHIVQLIFTVTWFLVSLRQIRSQQEDS